LVFYYSMIASEFIPEQFTLASAIEAILFSSSSPVPMVQLAEILEVRQSEIEEALSQLDQRYAREGGLSVQRHGGRLQLTTSPDMAPLVEKYLGLEFSSKLSRPALETMAIIAYKQPVTRPEIDAIRGVNSDGVIKSLLSKGLIQEAGRAETPGRPILYGTTADFLQNFGLRSLEELPPFYLEAVEAPSSGEQNFLKD